MDTAAIFAQAPLFLAVLAGVWAAWKAVTFGIKAALLPLKIALVLLFVGIVLLTVSG